MKRTGFTLIELTVVVAIVGILAAILFPVFAQARAKGWMATCQSNLYQMGTAMQLYARDHDGRLPPAHNDFSPLMAGYVESGKIFRCPDDPGDPGRPGAPALDPLRFPSYQYRGGLTLEDRADIPLAAEWDFHHNEGGNILYLSGSVKWGRYATWVPVAPGPRPLPPGITVPAGIVPMPFLNSPAGQPASIPAPSTGPPGGGE